MAQPQQEIDGIWAKYRNALTQLNEVLDENLALKEELDLDFTMPADIAELEAKIEARLGNNA